MIKIIVFGIGGKMGKTLRSVAAAREDAAIVCGIDKDDADDYDFPVLKSVFDFHGKADAIIDFSSPSSCDDICAYADAHKTAVVFAATGHTDDQIEKINALSKKVPVSLLPSAAPAMNALFAALPELCRDLSDCDVFITETHRAGKKDKPSGTALKLKSILDGARKDEKPVEIHSLRGGDIPGTHEITFLRKGESLSVRHVVYSREVFAEGALDECVRLCKTIDKNE